MEPAGLLPFSAVGAFTDHNIPDLRSLSTRRPSFDSRPVHVGFFNRKNDSGTAFVGVPRTTPVIIISPTINNHSSITDAI
jgi:hypothetical protein